MMNEWRRRLCKGLTALPVVCGVSACAKPQPSTPQAPGGRPWTPEELQRMHRFRGVEGYETVISGFGVTRGEGLFGVFKNQNGQTFEEGVFWEGRNSKSSLAIRPPGLMKSINAKVYVDRGKELLLDVDIPVADRIPDELLDELRRGGGGLRIKIRLHREGVLLGWDIERRPGYDPRKKDEFGNPIHVRAVHSFAGGDFREAHIFNGQVMRKGWYIHPKTGQRIETDF